jgi:hypothetical protein
MASQTSRPAPDQTALPAWTLLKTVGTFSIFMDLHPLLDPMPGAARLAEAANAKRDSTIHHLVSTNRSPISENFPMLVFH